ncbi:BON domain-containing protein [Phosphitispora fastidiosa]|uniref:BON domain-containing protein n=1 Tax=Phosphitispora fastidiosa TaxID=2837202 RepID=UPI001E3859C0|nr:BON domain-containing protein [Phosphitispora fastidiosa]MBU7007264.1 osmotically-inducible protein OsmY [Phosphitispora fastidiosa]
MISDDTSIQRNVENVLKNNRLLRNADIKIETRNGEVTLFGFVDVLAEKWAAGAAVAQVPGVTSVDNSLTVAVDGPIDDSDVGEGVREKFCAADRNYLHELTAEVNDGVVCIRGQAESLAVKEAAVMAAAGVPGVKDVVSILHIGVPE